MIEVINTSISSLPVQPLSAAYCYFLNGCGLGELVMANSPAPVLDLRGDDRERLESLTRSRTAEAGAVMRARIVLAGADGVANERIAEQLQVSKNTVLAWRRRYADRGMASAD